MEKQSQTLTTLDEQAKQVPTNLFGNKDFFDHAQRVALMLSKTDLVPKQFQNNVGNCIVALELANRIGASPLMVMQNLYIVHGKPAWSSTFLIASVNASGKFSPLRYEQDNKNGGRVRAWAIDKGNNEKVFGAWVTMEMAKAEGWIDKNGSKWKTMPELMLRYRASSFFARQFAPEISMGIHTIEEVHDIPHIEVISEEDWIELNELFDLKSEHLSEQEVNNAVRIIEEREVKSFAKLKAFLATK